MGAPLSPVQDPRVQQWEHAVIGASPVLAADRDARAQVISKLYRQYLPAAFKARTPEAELRVWTSLGYYLTTPPTSRKPFALSAEEADAVVEAIRQLVERLPKEDSLN